MVYNPVSTYRIQFSKDFTFNDFEKTIPYLNKLGIKTIYASPIFRAVTASSHGYDVTSPLIINQEIGTFTQFKKISKKLRSLNMGWIQDIVPNHMAFSPENTWIADVLEKGIQSDYARFFDIDWEHNSEDLKGKLMLPFLGNTLSEAIHSGELKIDWDTDKFVLNYYENTFPLNFQSQILILKETFKGRVDEEIQGVLKEYGLATETPEKASNPQKILKEKYENDKETKTRIETYLAALNKDKESIESIIDLQYYRPTFWKASERMLNYRRFFTINGMICLKMEDKKVFEAYHAFIKKLCDEDLIQGLRVDHIDGLKEPHTYLEMLRQLAGEDKHITVEKILEKGEGLEKHWPVQGETGYEFLSLANNLLTNEKNSKQIDKTYDILDSSKAKDFSDIIYEKKKFILYNRMTGDLENLFYLLLKLNLFDGDAFPETNIKNALGEFLINCPVYKIYAEPEFFTEKQKTQILHIYGKALKRTPELKNELRFFKSMFLLEDSQSWDKVQEINSFFRRCMQFTGALMAKGAEDTAYYTFNRFILHNEVGDSPSYFGISKKAFHDEMKKRQKDSPLTLNALSTHDTKRGEDARARLAVLSDIPELWQKELKRWQRINESFKNTNQENEIPSLNDEYFIYQTLVGFMPVDIPVSESFIERLGTYLIKALREGKEESNWVDPDKNYEVSTLQFVRSILADDSVFLQRLIPFIKKVDYLGKINSFAQTLLKITVPGVPDTYQGSEDYNFSFVDPDNRRPINFGELSEKLNQFDKKGVNDKNISPINPGSKFHLTHLLLKNRSRFNDVFEKGEYIPLNVHGKLKEHVFAYARSFKDVTFICVIPLHLGALLKNKSKPDLSKVKWKNTTVELPDYFPKEYINLITDEKTKFDNDIDVSELITDSAVAIMKGQKEQTERSAGILMHITSLPGKFNVGDFGPEAYKFADFLKRSGQKYWQVLPLNQVSKLGAYSPYSALSAYAGNVFLISPELLAEDDLLESLPKEIKHRNKGKVNYKKAEKIKEALLDSAFQRFNSLPFLQLKKEFKTFCEQEAYWLEDYSLFITLKKEFKFKEWRKWLRKYKNRDEETLTQFKSDNQNKIDREKFAQFMFFRQWNSLKTYCNERDIKLFGDIPIYISFDSADVWSHPEYFKLDKRKRMISVAGVPPDYFNKNGQRWGMPIFDWEKMKADGYQWWKSRVRKNLEMFDLIRLDHFRGFSAYWDVPAKDKTAINGTWIKGPGSDLFDALKSEFPDLPFVAEDLGEIDQPVYDLRDKYDFPGMKVLQFGFGKDSDKSIHAPHNHVENCVVYTGTHDNNTLKGWFKKEASKESLSTLNNYLGKKVHYKDCHNIFIKLAYSSVAKFVIIPMQDILGLNEKSRMNIPSTEKGNWQWRMAKRKLTPEIEKRLSGWSRLFGR